MAYDYSCWKSVAELVCIILP